jgi:hypothetical protein
MSSKNHQKTLFMATKAPEIIKKPRFQLQNPKKSSKNPISSQNIIKKPISRHKLPKKNPIFSHKSYTNLAGEAGRRRVSPSWVVSGSYTGLLDSSAT